MDTKETGHKRPREEVKGEDGSKRFELPTPWSETLEAALRHRQGGDEIMGPFIEEKPTLIIKHYRPAKGHATAYLPLHYPLAHIRQCFGMIDATLNGARDDEEEVSECPLLPLHEIPPSYIFCLHYTLSPYVRNIDPSTLQRCDLLLGAQYFLMRATVIRVNPLAWTAKISSLRWGQQGAFGPEDCAVVVPMNSSDLLPDLVPHLIEHIFQSPDPVGLLLSQLDKHLLRKLVLCAMSVGKYHRGLWRLRFNLGTDIMKRIPVLELFESWNTDYTTKSTKEYRQCFKFLTARGAMIPTHLQEKLYLMWVKWDRTWEVRSDYAVIQSCWNDPPTPEVRKAKEALMKEHKDWDEKFPRLYQAWKSILGDEPKAPAVEECDLVTEGLGSYSVSITGTFTGLKKRCVESKEDPEEREQYLKETLFRMASEMVPCPLNNEGWGIWAPLMEMEFTRHTTLYEVEALCPGSSQ